MNNQEQINLIREKCIASNPEIIELKFGCFFLAKGELRMMTQDCVGGIRALTIIEDEGDMVYAYPETFYQKADMRILGRPIHLADVLVAMNQRKDIVQKYDLWLTGVFNQDGMRR